MEFDPYALVEERQEGYGEAWQLVGESLHPALARGLYVLTQDLPEAFFPWVMILAKLIRALKSPANADHWKDIAGYATLVVKYLEERENGKILRR